MGEKKFRLLINGRKFLINTGEGLTKHGFYTTRFIETDTVANAERIAINLIKKELEGVVKNKKSDTPMIYIEEITALESFGDALIPGAGFAWYEENDKQ